MSVARRSPARCAANPVRTLVRPCKERGDAPAYNVTKGKTMEEGSTIIYNVDLTQVETLLTEQNELIKAGFEQLHTDAEIMICSMWLLCGVVVGVAVGLLFYRLWRS